LETGRRFDPKDEQSWLSVSDWLDEQFLWMPPDYVAHKAALTKLLTTASTRPDAALRFSSEPVDAPIFEQPQVLLRRDLIAGATPNFQVVVVDKSPGVSARRMAQVRDVEAELVRHSGKETDGIYSRFNRWLCWPAVGWLSHTHVTPNTVSFLGLGAGVVAAVCFAQGAWAWNVTGAVWFFISGLFDEIDGMLARLKFQESAFGCWLETFVDYATYLLAFAGMTVGGYRQGGSVYLAVGAVLLFGCLLSFVVISVQRKLAAPTRPTDYYQRFLKALDRDAGNPISKATRNLQFLLRKGVLIHYVLLFAVLNLTSILFFLAAFGANAAWIVTLYMNRRLFLSNKLQTSAR
jgi:phosphatidylglycerophosphate synthase